MPANPMASHAAWRTRKMYEWPYSCSAVTAEALKIITAPSRHSTSVTMNRQRSFSSRLGIAFPRIHRIHVRTSVVILSQMANQFFENAATVFVILKLVEACAGRREQDNVTGTRGVMSAVHSIVERADTLNCHAALDLLFDLVRRCANQ